MRQKYIFLSFGALTLLAIAVLALTQFQKPAGSREDELSYLRVVLPEALLDVSNLQVASKNNVAIFTEDENAYLGLRLFARQQKVNSGVRAEISVDYPFQAGETVRYSWRFMLPNDFISDAPQNRWWIMAQWHDQPNPALGESWEEERFLLSPPIALSFGEADGQIIAVMTYGVDVSRNIGWIPIEKGIWHDISVVIHWSQDESGSASVYFDIASTSIAAATGANMRNDYQHFFKLGMYRHPDIATENWIFVDSINVFKETAP